jgi:hypothetical protein
MISKSTIRHGLAAALFVLPAVALAAPFTNNSIVVLSAGGQDPATPNIGVIDGVNRANGLTDTPSQVYLREFRLSGAHFSGTASLRQTLLLPSVATSSGNRAFTLASNSGSEGELRRSADGRYLTAIGYNDTARATLITNSANGQSAKANASTTNRTLLRVDQAGSIDTTTALRDAYNGDNVRGAVSADGTQFWTAGNVSGASQANSGGVRYTTLGSTTSTRVAGADSTPTFTRNVNKVAIFNGQLYAATRNGAFSGIWAIGSGTSATTLGTGTPSQLFAYTAATLGNPAAFQGPYDFYPASIADPTLGAGLNTAYVADAILGISKFTKNTSGAWSLAYTFSTTGGRFEAGTGVGGATGLEGYVRADGTVQLFAVSGFNGSGILPGYGGVPDTVGGNRLFTLIDQGANSAYTVLATAGPTEHFAGVALAPVPTASALAPELAGLGTLGLALRRRRLRAA